MQKQNKQERYDVGRVIFGEQNGRPLWRVNTLRSHVGNVVALTNRWNAEKAYLQAGPRQRDILTKTQPWLQEAARIHDDAKPLYFRLTCKHGRRRNEWGYSFAGHRFGVEHENPYIYWLVRLHHSYAVHDIVEAMAQLQLPEYLDETFNPPLAQTAPLFALDLYALEMADQIEATVARSVLEAEEPEARVFMDFLFKSGEGEHVYAIDPFPFRQIDTTPTKINLPVEFVELQPPVSLVEEVEAAAEDKRRPHLQELKNWLLDALQDAPKQTTEATLCPW